MRRVRFSTATPGALLPTVPVAGVRSPYDLSVTLSTDAEAPFPSACLRCPDEPCRKFGNAEVDHWLPAEHVCPVDAIVEAQSATGPQIAGGCVGCGACATRCPVGAITVPSELTRPVVAPPDITGVYGPVTESAFTTDRHRLAARISWSSVSPEALAEVLYQRAATLYQAQFYPLVATLFSVAGFPAWCPPQGDTSNRMDLILLDPEDSLPVEVKSRTEVEAINVKSVQQALENKIILDERNLPRARRDSSTLVVGYEYPPDRSAVNELVRDIKAACGISVGLISLRELYILALTRVMTNVVIPRDRLSQLEGRL
jgi:Fe-S-cluster-containing hydrogenase component 2